MKKGTVHVRKKDSWIYLSLNFVLGIISKFASNIKLI